MAEPVGTICIKEMKNKTCERRSSASRTSVSALIKEQSLKPAHTSMLLRRHLKTQTRSNGVLSRNCARIEINRTLHLTKKSKHIYTVEYSFVLSSSISNPKIVLHFLLVLPNFWRFLMDNVPFPLSTAIKGRLKSCNISIRK